jgi:hypothetical protein
VHTGCGHVAHALQVCSECGDAIDARSVKAVAGAAAHPGDFERTALAKSTR